jgi:LPPG:FO 2-phospho-L-lactate transferase
VCPSNPFVSIAPILAVPALRAALAARRVPLVAVSPIIAGLALKGPTAKIMQELSMPQTAAGVAAHYGTLLDGFVLDQADAASVDAIRAQGPAAIAAQTVMVTLADRIALARTVLDFVATLNVR